MPCGSKRNTKISAITSLPVIGGNMELFICWCTLSGATGGGEASFSTPALFTLEDTSFREFLPLRAFRAPFFVPFCLLPGLPAAPRSEAWSPFADGPKGGGEIKSEDLAGIPPGQNKKRDHEGVCKEKECRKGGNQKMGVPVLWLLYQLNVDQR